jgi:PAS domain S-box-containing protein
MLAVMVSATRGGFLQGLFATFLSLVIEISLWGDWAWFIPAVDSYHSVELFFYLIEGILVSLLADFYLNGRLALRHSQTRFQILFDAIPVGAVIHDQDKMVIANQTFAEMFGYRQHELTGKQLLSVVASESAEEIERYLWMRSEEKYRMTGLRQNGATFAIEVSGKEINYQDRPMRVTVMRDLTDHLIARQRLEQMNESLEARVVERTTELAETVADLRVALENVKTLSGLLPICGSCKRIRDDDGYWSQVEDYISAHSTAEFSHSLCPECLAKLREEIQDWQHRLDVRDSA